MVNQLPQGWKEDRIDNLSYKILSGGTPNRSISSYYGGNIPWVKTGEVQDCIIYDTEEKITEEGLKNSSAKVFPKGTLLVALYGATAAKLAILAIDAATNQACCGIQVDENKILMKYIYYYLLDQRSNLLALTSGAGQQNLNVGKIKNYYISYPTDKYEQDYIVKTLDAVAEMIKLRKETIDLTKKLIPAIFQEMFGDPITNPKGWEILSLDNIITQINNGYNPPKKDFGTGIPFVTVNNLYNGLNIDYDSLDKVMVSNKQIQKYKLNYGDICFVRSSVKREGIGQASAYLSNQDAIFGGFVIRVTPKKTFNPIFLSEYFQTEAMRNIIINKSVTGVMTNINQPALLSIPVLNVPLFQQEEFANKVEQINKNLEVQQKDLERLQELFDQLLQKAFTGELTRGVSYGK